MFWCKVTYLLLSGWLCCPRSMKWWENGLRKSVLQRLVRKAGKSWFLLLIVDNYYLIFYVSAYGCSKWIHITILLVNNKVICDYYLWSFSQLSADEGCPIFRLRCLTHLKRQFFVKLKNSLTETKTWFLSTYFQLEK